MVVQRVRAQTRDETRKRIVDVARVMLGRDPSAGLGEVAVAAGVVRRTVYGHFPSRSDLLLALAELAVQEMVDALGQVNGEGVPADEVWARFVGRLWPLTDRYRVLLEMRRGEHGARIHALLGSFDESLADLVWRGQDGGLFGRHLPAEVAGRIAYASVFTIADARDGLAPLDAAAAITTSLLVLGVPEERIPRLLTA